VPVTSSSRSTTSSLISAIKAEVAIFETYALTQVQVATEESLDITLIKGVQETKRYNQL
jgi:hypothetical protein